MTPHIPEELSSRIDWRRFAIMSNTMPPRYPNDDEEDEDKEEDEEEDQEENRTEEPPVVREPDED